MERTEILAAMGGLKLFGMRSAYDEIMATAVKRKHEPQKVVSDLMTAEISEKQARSIKYQLTIAKLPFAKEIEEFVFEGTPINEALVRDLAGAHFHGPATTEENAGVVVNIGAISGLESPSAGSTIISDEVEQWLLAGLLYINVHTELNPAGEIRGQVVPAPIPLPATLPLLLASAGALFGLRRRRRT